jgi:hypothetical protein
MLLLLLACAIGDAGPAASGSPSATELATIEALGKQAAEIEAMTFQVEQDVDRLRRGELAGGDGVEAARLIESQVAEIKDKEAALRQAVTDLEQRVRVAAGDPTLLTEAAEDEVPAE